MARIYLDYASLTPIDPRVLREMKKYSSAEYANPSSLYKEGVSAKKALEAGRTGVADFVHAHPDEIIFTSGGTEANGLVLESAARTAHRNGNEKPHLIISAIEHSSIMECASMLEKHGVEVTRLSVDSRGLISVEELKKALKPSTYLVSIMTVNNEIGTVQPIREIAKIIRHARKNSNNSESSNSQSSNYPLFHTDAAQAALHSDLNMEQLGVDFLTLDGSKAYGPRSTGALYVRRSAFKAIEPIMYGGGQERGLRSGTENIPAIMGFAAALHIARKEREKESKRIARLREQLLAGLKKIRPDVEMNPSDSNTLNILNISIPGIDNELFVLRLDAKGIAISTKSSCLRDADESYVLQAIKADSKTAIRFSFGRWTKGGDVKKTLKAVKEVLEIDQSK